MPEYEPCATNRPTDDMVRAYLDAAEWTIGDDNVKLLALADAPHWTPEAIDHAERTVAHFRAWAEGISSDVWEDDPGRAGHDLWLTRNGHGAGFWDGYWPEDESRRATDYCKRLGEVCVVFYSETNGLDIIG